MIPTPTALHLVSKKSRKEDDQSALDQPSPFPYEQATLPFPTPHLPSSPSPSATAAAAAPQTLTFPSIPPLTHCFLLPSDPFHATQLTTLPPCALSNFSHQTPMTMITTTIMMVMMSMMMMMDHRVNPKHTRPHPHPHSRRIDHPDRDSFGCVTRGYEIPPTSNQTPGQTQDQMMWMGKESYYNG